MKLIICFYMYVFFSFQMNILLASSRGVGLASLVGKEEPLAKFSSTIIKPGGKLSTLRKEAAKIIPSENHCSAIPHVYILAGVPDITTKVSHQQGHRTYTESILIGDTEDKIKHIKDEIDTCEAEIRRRGAKPIFCTISLMNITHYNNFLLNTGRTYELRHEARYNTMQTQIEHIIAKVNTHIRLTNRTNSVSTPFLHSTVLKRHGKGRRGYYKPDWNTLYDGIHATDTTKEKWANTLTTAISYNRKLKQRKRKHSSSEEEPQSPKRSWLRERDTNASTTHH